MQRSLLEQLHCASHRGTLEFPVARIPIWIVFHLQLCLSVSFVYSSDNLELCLISCISNGHDSRSRVPNAAQLPWPGKSSLILRQAPSLLCPAAI